MRIGPEIEFSDEDLLEVCIKSYHRNTTIESETETGSDMNSFIDDESIDDQYDGSSSLDDIDEEFQLKVTQSAKKNEHIFESTGSGSRVKKSKKCISSDSDSDQDQSINTALKAGTAKRVLNFVSILLQ